MFDPKASASDSLISAALGFIAGIVTTLLWTFIINILGVSYPKGVSGFSLSVWIVGFPIILSFLIVTSIIIIALNHLTDSSFSESKNSPDVFIITAFFVTLILALFLQFS